MADARSWIEEEAAEQQVESAFERRVPRHDNPHARRDKTEEHDMEEGGASAPLSPPKGYTNSFKQESVLPKSTSAVDICVEAARLVGGSRAEAHGDKALNFQIIAAVWNGYWNARFISQAAPSLNAPFNAKTVGDLMELMKVARRLTGTFNLDDYIDSAGYAACTGEIAAKEAAKEADRVSSPR